MLGENDGPSMISYAADGAAYGLRFFCRSSPCCLRWRSSARRCPCGSARSRTAATASWSCSATGRSWGWFAAADLTFTNLVTLVSEFVAIRVGLAYFGLGSPAWPSCSGWAGPVYTRRATLLALGAPRARSGAVQRSVSGRCDPVKPHFGPSPARSTSIPSRAGASTSSCCYRVHDRCRGHAVDDLLPAKRVRGQGHDPTRHQTRPLRHRGRRGFGGSLRGCRTHRRCRIGHPQWIGYPGFRGCRVPSGDRSRRRSGGGECVRARTSRGGAVAILTISASTAYAAGECVGVAHSSNSSPRHAVVFHAVNVGAALVAAAVILIPGAPLLAIALNANVLATVLLPVSLVFLLMLANDGGLMGPWANKRSTNAIGIAVVIVVGLCGAAYGIDSFLLTTHLLGS